MSDTKSFAFIILCIAASFGVGIVAIRLIQRMRVR